MISGASKSAWMIAFTSKEDDKFDTAWAAAALKLKNTVRFAQVDCSDMASEALAASLGIDSFPAIKVCNTS